MLVIEISKKKPKPVITPTTNYNNWKTPGQVLVDEFKRRDEIIKKLVKECGYKPGDICTPSLESNAAKYGSDINVLRMIDSYSKMGGTEEWNDNPMIVEACGKDGVIFWCTTNYLKPMPKKEC